VGIPQQLRETALSAEYASASLVVAFDTITARGITSTAPANAAPAVPAAQ